MKGFHIDCGYILDVTPLFQRGDCRDVAKHTPCPDGYVEWQEWAKLMAKTHAQVKCQMCGCWTIWLPKAEARKVNAADRKAEREFVKAYQRMWNEREACSGK